MKKINPGNSPNSNYGIGGEENKDKGYHSLYIYYLPGSTARDYIHDSFNPQDNPKDRFLKSGFYFFICSFAFN